MKKPPFLLFFFPVWVLLSACGLEDYPYIYPIPQSSIIPQMNDFAVVHVSGDNVSTSFSHFVIFYRIYASDVLEVSTTSKDTYGAINNVLSQDHNFFNRYIDSDTLVNTNLDTLFRGREYKYLEISPDSGDSIDNVLSGTVLGSRLEFDFSSSQKYPTMTKITPSGTSGPYTLWRSNGSGLFMPRPDRYFVNSDELRKRENINSQYNADVADKAGSGNLYAYAALYIAGVGIDTGTYSYVYRTPSLIHVFLLPGS
jgi:hypothetical protein